MTVVFPHLCYNEVYYKGTGGLYLLLLTGWSLSSE